MASNNELDKHVSDILTCSLCLEILNNPRTLMCLHSYCEHCLSQLQLEVKEDVNGYECPLCRAFTATSEIRRAHVIMQLLDAYNVAKGVKMEVKCDTCKTSLANWMCIDCKHDYSLCDKCKEAHDKFLTRIGMKHEVLTLNEIIGSTRALERPLYCEMHKEYKLEVFCRNCEKVICVLCKVLEHDAHQSLSISSALELILPKVEKSLQQLETDVKGREKNIEKKKEELHESMKTFEIEKTKAAQNLEDAISKLKDNYEKQLNEINRKCGLENDKRIIVIQNEEIELKGDEHLISWIKAIQSRTAGARLLVEFQLGLSPKLLARLGDGFKQAVSAQCLSAQSTSEQTSNPSASEHSVCEPYASEQSASEQSASGQSASAQPASTQAPSAQSASAQSESAQSASTQSARAQSASAQSASVQSPSEKSARVQSAITQHNAQSATNQSTIEQSVSVFNSNRVHPFEFKRGNYKLTKTITICRGRHFQHLRISIVWGRLFMPNHITHELVTYSLEGTHKKVKVLDDRISSPRAVVGLDEESAAVAADTGLFIMNRQLQIIQHFRKAVYTDVFITERESERVVKFACLDTSAGKVDYFKMTKGGWKKTAPTHLLNYKDDNKDELKDVRNQLIILEDTILVAFVGSNNIMKYGLDGTPISYYNKHDHDFVRPSLCAVDSESSILICNANEGKFKVLTHHGCIELILHTELYPWYAVFEHKKAMWIVYHDNTLRKYEYN